ncbi:MATE family efflux transporter [Paracoccus laeviglucosivorans]|uniref:Multidrug-efflux transporter n=1 Tax=Paracoccus laeviglucosivorans TaxID=1197861 RepID=A0A521AU62_9RHOB|nr:MATE family efflux transporter [Paracoccus laeviglucosivorans]SMO38325.1 multidrug resistance protein, MATE family [Paracoccus laeviglucosivorans]
MISARYAPHLRATLALGLPLVGSHLSRMAIGVADTVMLGWYGVNELAALVIAMSFFHILYFLGMGFGIGVMGVIAAAIARGDEVEVRRSARMALWLSLISSVISLPLMWHAGPILLAIGQAPVVAELAQEYLRIAGFGLVAMLCQLTLNSYLAAMERPQVVLWITLAGLPLVIFLNWVLIFGNLGMPEMGVRGAAIAAIIVQFLQLAVMLAYAHWLPAARHYHLFQRFWKPDWSEMRKVFALGLPIGLTMVAEGGLFVGSNVMMGWIGTQQLAAHGIALQLASITFMLHLGISNAATVRIGQAKGRGDAQGMRDAAVTVIAVSVVLALACIAAFELFPRQLVSLYLDVSHPETPAIITMASGLLFYAGIFQLTDAMQVIALGFLRGVQDTRVPMVIAAVSYWVVGIPVAYGLAFMLGVGPAGLWLGLVAGLSFAAVLLMRRFWRGFARGDWTAAPATV